MPEKIEDTRKRFIFIPDNQLSDGVTTNSTGPIAAVHAGRKQHAFNISLGDTGG